MTKQKCDKCGNYLIQMVVNGRQVLACENCLRKQGHVANIDMMQCSHCGLWFYQRIENVCLCRQICEDNYEE